MIVRIKSEEEFNRAIKWCSEELGAEEQDGGGWTWCDDGAFYLAFDFGEIRFSNVEDLMYFKLAFEGDFTVFDPNRIDPDSVGGKAV